MRLFCQYAGQWIVSAALKIKKAPKIRSFSILCKDWIRTIKAVPTQYIVYFAAGSREIYSNQKPALRAGLVIYVGKTGQISNNFIRDLRAVQSFFEQFGEL